MGLRFRKSFKIAPGVKLNLNKKSSSVTFGGKGAHYTVNSKGKTTKSVGIPGTGIYYTETSDKKRNPRSSTPVRNTQTGKRNNEKSYGCLFYLLAFLAICLGIAFYSFLWVPGIIAIIYFAIKKSEPTKKKKRLIISIAVTLSSFLISCCIGSSNELTSIEAKWSKNTYDINDTTEVELSVTPESSVIESLEISENDIAELEYKDNKAIITFKKVGTASIFFTANESVDSNTVKIKVIDKESEKKRIEEEKKKEEERLRAEQEAKAEAERIKAEQEAAKKAEAERIASEKAAAEKAEQERIAAEKAAAQESNAANEQQTQSVEATVWLSATGEKYHRIPNCGRMNPDKARQISLSDALSKGYEACNKCY